MSAERAAERVRRAIKHWLDRPEHKTSVPVKEEKAWMGTVTGRQFRPFDPQPADIDIRDIARGLAMTCRYGGQVKRFYSVAEHCVYVSMSLPEPLRLYGLLHDSAEAYIGDLIRPIKHQPQMSEFRRAEELIEKAVAKHFGLEWTSERHLAVKDIDDRILIDEITALSAIPLYYLNEKPLCAMKPLGRKINCWDPCDAENAFIRHYENITGRIVVRV